MLRQVIRGFHLRVTTVLTEHCLPTILGMTLFALAATGQDFTVQEFNLDAFRDADSVAVDETGLYVIGSNESYLRKFDRDGQVLWTRIFAQPFSRPVAVAAGDGRVYVSVDQHYSSLTAMFYALDSEGAELWSDETPAFGRGIAVDDTGAYLINGGSGDGTLRRYTADGDLLWTQTIHGKPFTVALDSEGIYWGGRLYGSLGGFLEKRSRDGHLLWARQFEGDQAITHLAVSAGAVYSIQQRESWDSAPELNKHDADGIRLWSRDPENSEGLNIGGVVADDTGVYVVGVTIWPLPDNCMTTYEDGFIRRYDSSGEPIWIRQLGNRSSNYQNKRAALDGDAVYVAGSGGGLVKVDKDQPAIGSGPWIGFNCVVNAASFHGGQVSPGELISIFGRELGPGEAALGILPDTVRAPTTLAGTRVLFNGIAAPLLFVSAGQINAVAPYAISDWQQVSVEVERDGTRSNVRTVPVVPVNPGLFSGNGSGRGHLLAVNHDGTLNSEENPAERGTTIRFFATGLGLLTNPVDAGLVLGTGSSLPRSPWNVWFCCYSDQFLAVSSQTMTGVHGAVSSLHEITVGIPSDLRLNEVSRDNPVGQVSVVFEIGGSRIWSNNTQYVYIRNVGAP